MYLYIYICIGICVFGFSLNYAKCPFLQKREDRRVISFDHNVAVWLFE